MLLISTNTYADKKKSLLNFYFDLPEKYILTSEITAKYIENNKFSEQEKKDLLIIMESYQPYSGVEMFFTKDIMINGGDNIIITSVKNFFGNGEEVKSDIEKYCNGRLQVLQNANKDRVNKRNEDKDIIQNHKCFLVDIPAYVDFSVFESHLNLANNNIVVYQIQFPMPETDQLITILLSCERYCETMLPVFEKVVMSIHFGKCLEGDCDNGTGTLTYKDGSKYIGTFKGGIENGPGTWFHKDGSKFIGQFLKGYINGYGKYIHEDGTEYNGEYKDGLTHGKGTWTFANGTKYIGDNKFGYRDGHGIETMPDGEKYVGGFKKDKKHGKGIWTFADGAKFEGSFDSEKGTMKGKYIYSDGKVEAGTWDSDGNFTPSIQ